MVDFFHSLVPLCAAPLERQYRRTEACGFHTKRDGAFALVLSRAWSVSIMTFNSTSILSVIISLRSRSQVSLWKGG